MTQNTLAKADLDQIKVYLDQLTLSCDVQSERPNFGKFEPMVTNIEDLAAKSRNKRAVAMAITNLKLREKIDQELKKLPDYKAEARIEIVQSELAIPPLPDALRYPTALAAGACPWLDEYETFSSHWAPRGYKQYHTACGLWTLSTTAARRAWVPFGPNGEYSSLYTAIVGRTTQHTKSTTASVAKKTLRAAGLDWLLCSDTITPQKLISNMSGRIPRNYGELDVLEQEKVRLRYGMSGQIGWLYDEFGQHLDAMTAKNGIMADFKSMLRRFDDCEESTSNDTISRDLEKVDQPYMSLCGLLTPSDIKPYAGKDSKFWRDGFFARFAIACPPEDDRNRSRYPQGEMIVPSTLTTPLVQWHKRLGVPVVEISEEVSEKSGKGTGNYTAIKEPLSRHTYTLGSGVEDALYNYSDALDDIVYDQKLDQLAGNYGRMKIKALRVSLLFASLQNSPTIEMSHWARAQAITEEWRESLHRLYSQANQAEDTSAAYEEEEDIIRIISKLSVSKPPTAREVQRYTRKYDTPTLRKKLRDLALAGVLQEIEGKAPRYLIVEED